MSINVPQKLKTLALACNFPLYIVGGYVRDALAGLKTGQKDIDICAPADVDSMLSAAKSCGAEVYAVYRNTGTVKLGFEDEKYEFTSFRSDEYVRGVHTPVKSFFTDDIRLDALRRDFKCNAIYYNIKTGEIVAPIGGLDDIKKGVLNTVADPDKVFGEDGLRLMRLARQAAQLGFEPSAECLAGATRNAALIKDISAERIYAELDAILHADARYNVAGAQYKGLKVLEKTGVLDYILPELTLGRGMEQRKEFHNYDVLEHSLRSALYADYSIRWAALLHDIGKPYCMQKYGTYHGHEAEGERIVYEVGERLKMPKKLTAEAARLCALHMYDLKGDARENKIRKLIVENNDIFQKLLYIKQCDFSACRDDLSVAPCVTKWRAVYDRMGAEGAPKTLKELKVKGNELLAAGIPAERVGTALFKLLLECAYNPKLNDNCTLIKMAQKLYGAGE